MKSLSVAFLTFAFLNQIESGDFVSTLADGTSYVYNNGDVAWIMTSAALGKNTNFCSFAT